MKRDNITHQQRKLMNEIKDPDMALSVIEKMIIERARGVKYGNLIIFIEDGVPQRTEVRVSTMLTPDSFNK